MATPQQVTPQGPTNSTPMLSYRKEAVVGQFWYLPQRRVVRRQRGAAAGTTRAS